MLRVLSVDIGNSTAKLGLFVDGEIAGTAVSVVTDRGIVLAPGFIEMVKRSAPVAVVASVNPPAEVSVERTLRKIGASPVLRIRRDIPVPIRCLCEQGVGDDRLANAVAAHHLAAGAALVVDLGTAITFDVISDCGDFVGGAIAPGVGSSARALNEFTAKLPLVEPYSPSSAIGRNTTDAINVGLVIGLAGLIDRIVRQITEELDATPTVIATGGHASLLAPHAATLDRIEQHLTLLGLQLIYQAQNP